MACRQVPPKPASLAVLQELGVLYWRLDADAHETDPKLAAIRKVRGYSYVEIITISKDTLPGYEEKIKVGELMTLFIFKMFLISSFITHAFYTLCNHIFTLSHYFG